MIHLSSPCEKLGLLWKRTRNLDVLTEFHSQ